MKLLVISDLHAANEVLDKMDEQFSQADAVLFAGDYAECFKPETGKPALEKLVTKHDTIYSVLGNCDNPDFIEELEKQDVCVENTLVYHDGLYLVGAGGGTIFTGKTENERTEEEILKDFSIVDTTIQDSGDKSIWSNLILISHNPPKDTKCDAVNAELHAGSQMFTDYIKENQPVAVVCGHIHEGAGVDKIGNTTVVNPGSLAEGKYAWLEISKTADGWKVDSAELKSL